MPSGQRTGFCLGDGHMYPIGQLVQFATPRKEKLPAAQGLIEELGVGQLNPAGQCLHDTAPLREDIRYYSKLSFL